jgi:Bacterial Ig domain/Putative Ig domain/RTX calcium-binding nonapeptide repeat (4 copies)
VFLGVPSAALTWILDSSFIFTSPQTMATAATQTGTFDLRRDQDFFKVSLVAGQRYLFKVEGSGAKPVQNPWLELFTPSSPALTFLSDVIDFGFVGKTAVIAYVALETGTHYLRTAANTLTGVTDDVGASYTISAESVALDDHSDIRAQGTVLNLGATLAGAFDLRHDLDYFRVTLSAGQRYLFTMTGAGAAPITGADLELFTPTGESLEEDTHSSTISGGGAKFAVVAPVSGTYYLLATLGTGSGSGAAEDTGTYSVTYSSVALDDHSDQRASGTVLNIGSTLAGAFDLRHDQDYFRVTLSAGQRVLFTMNGSGATPVQGSTLQLFDSLTGVADLVNDTTLTSLGGAKFSFQAPTAGTYYLLATLGSGATGGNGDTGTYAVSAGTLALDDHSDLRASGTALNIGGTVSGQFDQRADQDMFRVNLVEGQRYLFTMKGAGADPTNRVYLQMYDTTSAIRKVDLNYIISIPGLPSLGSSEAKFVYTAEATGTYVLNAQQGKDAFGAGLGIIKDTGTYTVNAVQVPLDDHADRATFGTNITVGATVAGAFDYRYDEDWFRVPLVAGQRYYVELKNTGATGGPTDTTTFVLLASSLDGTQVGYDTNVRSNGAAFVLQPTTSGTYYLYTTLTGFVSNSIDTGSYTLKVSNVSLDDHSDIRDQGTVLIAGPAGNQPPTASNGSGTTAEDTPLTGTLPAATDPNGDPISYAKGSDPARGTVTVTAAGGYTYTPAKDYNGSDSFGFTVSDGKGGSTSYTQSVTITAVNDAPVRVNAIPGLNATVGALFSYVIPADTFSDVDSPTLTYSVAGSGGFAFPAWLSFNASTRTLSGTPGAGDIGRVEIRFRASDGSLFADDFAPLEVMTPANVPPVSTGATVNMVEDTVLNGTLPAATDANGDPITYARSSNPQFGSVTVNANGSYTYTPQANFFGTDGFGFTVSDGKGGSAGYVLNVRVSNVNDAPTGTLGLSGSARVGAALSANNSIVDVDGIPTGPVLQWLRNGSVINGATASSYTVLAADVGAALSVRASYTDGGGTAETVTSATVIAAADFNIVTGGTGNDTVNGSTGDDKVSGLAGNDTLNGLAGSDSLEGGDGNDVLNGGPGNDTLNGGAGLDIADYRGATAVNVNLLTGSAAQGGDSDSLISIEAVFGSSAADTFRGLDGPVKPGETFRGGAGNDSIDGGTGTDTAEFSGKLEDYTLTRTPGTMNIVVTHKNGGADGSDSLNNIEHLQFSDRIVCFGPRAEDVARVAFALWTPAIYSSATLFSKGISFYDNEFGYSFDFLCQVALQYHPETGAALAAKLKTSIPASSLSAQQLVDLMAANGGITSDTGRAAAVKAVALDAATTQQLELLGVTSKGVVATLNFDAEIYFGLLPG